MANGFYFDMTTCVGCRTCQVACKDRNNNETGINFREVKTYETGEFPTPDFYHYTSSCNHCEKPACVDACPVGAMQKKSDGTVLVEKDLCVGCQSCIEACPYGAPKFIESEGKTGKCDGCYALRKHGKNPVCVDSCMMRCLKFGDLEQFKKEKTVDELAILPKAKLTSPNIKIKHKKVALETDFTQKLV